MDKNMQNIVNRTGGGYSDWVATIRGFAALLVFISHLPFVLPLEIMFILGRIGVVIFFLIMGYLAIDSRKRRNRKQYLFNRFIRMYPVYWILLIAYFFVSGSYEIKDLIFNFTLFQEFLGSKCILGASWMMPIQVCFFIMLTVLSADFFAVDKKLGKFQFGDILFILIGIGSILCSVLRYISYKPFPTAFFLLIMIGLMGIKYNQARSFKWQIIYFEPILVISALLSYPDKCLAYFIAYNIGIIVFVVSDRININVICFKKLGTIGFTFFLGAGILYGIVCKFVDFSEPIYMIIIGSIIKFVLAIILAYFVTRFIENPLIKWSKKIEKKLE